MRLPRPLSDARASLAGQTASVRSAALGRLFELSFYSTLLYFVADWGSPWALVAWVGIGTIFDERRLRRLDRRAGTADLH